MPRFLFRPKWIAFHVLVASAVIAMVMLGFWQLRRLDERRQFNATVTERAELEIAPLTSVLDAPDFDPATSEWLTVTATGTYLPDQIVVFNRSQNGRAGDNVLTALALADGRTVLVNRGFVALGTPPPSAPATDVQVLARIRPTQERSRGGLSDAGNGPVTEIRRVDIGRIAPQLPGEVVPIYLDLIASEPAVSSSDPIPVPPPELSEGNHLSYAFQWFIFAVCVMIGWVLAVRRSLSSSVTTDAPAGRTPLDSRQPIADESTTAPT